MTWEEIANTRLLSQKISNGHLGSPTHTLSWLAAIQAQDFNMAKLALGVRIANSTLHSIETAINDGSIIRTHLLRPTWHLVAAKDVRWILELTAPHIQASIRSRQRQLELSASIVLRSNRLLERALRDRNELTREELVSKYAAAKIAINDNRLSHFLLSAELDQVICSGAMKKGKPTYAFFSDRIPTSKAWNRDAALAEIAQRYFASRCPSTLRDFTWWSGLPARDAKDAFEMVKGSFQILSVQSSKYVFPQSLPTIARQRNSLYLLPAFDEFLISYADRSASLAFVHEKKAVSSNGIFRPVIVRDGQVVGIWKRISEKGKLIIKTTPFGSFEESTKNAISIATRRLGDFYGAESEVVFRSIESTKSQAGLT